MSYINSLSEYYGIDSIKILGADWLSGCDHILKGNFLSDGFGWIWPIKMQERWEAEFLFVGDPTNAF